jgi:hypothetical protein
MDLPESLALLDQLDRRDNMEIQDKMVLMQLMEREVQRVVKVNKEIQVLMAVMVKEVQEETLGNREQEVPWAAQVLLEDVAKRVLLEKMDPKVMMDLQEMLELEEVMEMPASEVLVDNLGRREKREIKENKEIQVQRDAMASLELQSVDH